MATVDYTGDYYTYADTATSVQLYNNQMPVTTWDSGWTYPNTDAYTPVIPPEVIDDLKKRLYELEETKTKMKGDDKMTALWRVIILDPKSELFEEIKVIAKTKEMAIHKAISRSGMSAKYVDDFEIVVEKLIEYEKQSSKKELKEALKEAMEE